MRKIIALKVTDTVPEDARPIGVVLQMFVEHEHGPAILQPICYYDILEGEKNGPTDGRQIQKGSHPGSQRRVR
jgi:hypothetical protein